MSDSASTVAQGTFTICGPGKYSLSYTCTGPSCSSLDAFPETTCTSNGGILTCSNGVTCPDDSVPMTTFKFTQPALAVSQALTIDFGDCGGIEIANDGTTGGTNGTLIRAENSKCIPSGGSGSSSTTSTASSSTLIPPRNFTISRTDSVPAVTTATGETTHVYEGTQLHSTYAPPSAWPPTTYLPMLNGNTTELCRCSTVAGAYVPCGSELTASSKIYYFPEYTSYPVRTNLPSQALQATTYQTGISSYGYNTAVYSSSSHLPKSTGTTSTVLIPPPVYTSGSGRAKLSMMRYLWVFLFVFGIFQISSASAIRANHALSLRAPIALPKPVNITDISLSERQLKSGWKKFADLFGEYLAGKLTAVTDGGDAFADNLVAEIEKAICDHLAGLATGVLVTAVLKVDLVETCVATIYTGNALVAPELGFLSVFGASLLCNFIVSEALPGLNALSSAVSDEICNQPKPCGDLLNDPQNCGSCGNVCDTGSCRNGACTSNTCTGQTCSSFGPCGPAGSCVCASTTEGTGFCVDGGTVCASLATCSTSLDCGSGEICAHDTCCLVNVCVGATFCGGSSDPSSKLFRRLDMSYAEVGGSVRLIR